MRPFFITLLLLIAAASSIQAQEEENDSVVNVIGWFCTGDTLEYVYTSKAAAVSGNDTTVTESNWNKFRICVRDSTKKGYVMEYTPLDVEPNDTTSLQGRLTYMAARAALGSHVLFSTDEMGAFKEIVNWKEISEQSMKRTVLLIDSIYKDNPALSSTIAKADLMESVRKSFDETYGSKEKMSDLFAGLKLIFSFHGQSFPLGESEGETSSGKCYYEVAKGAIEGEEATSEDDYQLYVKVDFPEEHGMKSEIHYSYDYFADGWPRSFLVTNVEHYGGREEITQFHLDWVRKSWK